MTVQYRFLGRDLWHWEECDKHPSGRCKCPVNQTVIASDLTVTQMIEIVASASHELLADLAIAKADGLYNAETPQ